MRVFRSRSLWLAFLILILTASSALGNVIDVVATQWGVRSASGAYNTNNSTGNSWLVGYAGGEHVDAYWGFDLSQVTGNITSVSLVAYLADVNFQDINSLGYVYHFLRPDQSDGFGSAFTYNDLNGDWQHHNYASVYVKNGVTQPYEGATLCMEPGDWGCEIKPIYPRSPSNPDGYFGTDHADPALTFDPQGLTDINNARTSSGTFWLSANMLTTPAGHAEALIFNGSAPGTMPGQTPVTSGDTLYLKLTYDAPGGGGGGGVPEPASSGLMALGILGILAMCLKRA